MRKSILYVLSACLMLIQQGCISTREMTYFQGDKGEILGVQQPILPVIGVDDGFMMKVYSSDPSSVAPFNNQSMSTLDMPSSNALAVRYRVNSHGEVDLPVLGSIRVAGLTHQQLSDTLASRIRCYVKDAIVNIEIDSQSVSVLGQVHHPGRYMFSSSLSVLEALAMAGDLLPNAKRDCIVVMRREGDNMVRHVLNLRQQTVFCSPAFYLKKGDVVYILPKYAMLVR